MSNKNLTKYTAQMPSLGRDPTHVPDPYGDIGALDRLISDYRLHKATQRWKSHAEAMRAVQEAFNEKRIAYIEYVRYMQTIERFKNIIALCEEARAQAEHEIEQAKIQRQHDKEIYEKRRQETLANAEYNATIAQQKLDRLKNPPDKKTKDNDPLAGFREKLEQRQKIEDERDRLIEQIRAKARAGGKSEDDPDVELAINNLNDHAQRLIEQLYE